MFRFTQVLVLMVAIAWLIELTRCFLKKRRGEHRRTFDRMGGVGKNAEFSEVQLATVLDSAKDNRDA
jgi:hypothetical protein